MKIGMVSDTHGDVKAWKRVEELLAGCELILHAGDHLYNGAFNPILPSYNPLELAGMMNASTIPILHARGNCDSEVDSLALTDPIMSPYVFLVWEGMRIVVTHGDAYPDPAGLVAQGKRWGARLIVRGHTHESSISYFDGVTLFNPGSCSLPKGDGVATVGLLGDGELMLVRLADGEVLERSRL
jgi:hypothetical protein